MKIGLFLISIFLLLNTGCGTQKNMANQSQKDWIETMVMAVDKNKESENYFVGTISFAAVWILEHDVKNFEEILKVLEYSFKNRKDIKIAIEESVNGILIIDAQKIEGDN